MFIKYPEIYIYKIENTNLDQTKWTITWKLYQIYLKMRIEFGKTALWNWYIIFVPRSTR